MRDIIGRIVWNPWVYRITCGVLFVIVMLGLRYGANILRETHDRGLILSVCIPFIVAGLFIAWLVDRHRARPH